MLAHIARLPCNPSLTGIPLRTQTCTQTCRVLRLTRAEPEETHTVTSYRWYTEVPRIRSYSDATWTDAEDQEQS